MSLVVGHRTQGGGVVLAADTRVWRYVYECPASLEESRSKLVILRGDLAVGFAGDLSTDIDPAVRSIPPGADAEACMAHLAAASRGGRFSCVAGTYRTPPWEAGDREAVLASLTLLKIEAGESRELPVAWAGSREGFELFQGLMLGSRAASLVRNEQVLRNEVHFQVDGGRPASASDHMHAHGLRMRAALDEVIRSEGVPDVGDFLFEVYATRSGFRYRTDVDVFVEGPRPVEAGENVLPRPAQQGGYSPIRLEGHLHGDVYGRRYPAIYLLQGGFGYLYFSADGGVPRANLVRGATVREFVNRCRDEYGVLLHGVGVGPEGFFSVDAFQDVMRELHDRLRALQGQPVAIWPVGSASPTWVVVEEISDDGVVRAHRLSLRSAVSRILPFVSPPSTQFLRCELIASVESADELFRRLWKRSSFTLRRSPSTPRRAWP